LTTPLLPGDPLRTEAAKGAQALDEAATLRAQMDALSSQNVTLTNINADLNAQVATLTTQMGNQALTISGLNAQVATLTGDKAMLVAQVSTQATTITALNAQVQALAADKTTLAAQVTQLQSSNDGLNTQVTNQANTITGLLAQIATLQAQVADLQAQLAAAGNPPPPGGSVTVSEVLPGCAYFDSNPYFGQGATNDSQRFTAMNDWVKARQVAGGPMPMIVFGDRVYSTSTPITLWSSLNIGSLLGPSREFDRRPTIKWTGGGAATSSVFAWPTTAQSGQSYPSDGSPRDGRVEGLQFDLGGAHMMPPTTTYAGKTLWYWTLHDICAKNGRSAWVGYGTGTVFGSGESHFQNMSETIFDVGGSECSLIGDEGFSFMDTQNPGMAGKPLIKSKLEKSVIGRLMPTGRKDITPIELYGGQGTSVLGLSPDSQDSDPIYGAGIRITGGEGHIIEGACIKGVGSNPTLGPGGESNNRGMVHISGGTQHTVSTTRFIKSGTMSPDYAVVYVGPSASEVKVGPNAFIGWGTATAAYRQALTGAFATSINDTSARLVTAP
jgi:uncharacterized coiled-coil protein SlyX